jgi:hypothetical protein
MRLSKSILTIYGFLPDAAPFKRVLRQPASNMQILQKPAFDLFKAGLSGNQECFGTP